MKTLITDDQILISGCKQGEKSAMEMLYYRFSPVLFSLLRRYLSSRADAEDLLQETFIKVFTNISDYNGTGSFEGWLKRIAVNLALNHLKANKKFKTDFDSIDNIHVDIVASTIKTSSSLEVQDLLSIIDLLPEQKRTIFKLYDVDGYSHKEIADMLGITEAGSRSQLAKARAMLASLHTKINNYERQ